MLKGQRKIAKEKDIKRYLNMNKSEWKMKWKWKIGDKKLMGSKISPDEQPFAFEDEYFSDKDRTAKNFTSS